MDALSGYISSLGPAFLATGACVLILTLADRDGWRARTFLLVLTTWLGWRYMVWRYAETVQPFGWNVESLVSWAFAILETMAIAASSLAALFLSRTSNRTAEVNQHRSWWGGSPPRLDVFITTYDEELPVLERTIAGARQLLYPNASIFVLDDGRRSWLADYCREAGVGYIARTSNEHAKAGNLNHAFGLRRNAPDSPDFIAVFDADFVPHRDFASRALALFHDPHVAVVQTPQHFFNADPVQNNLGLAGSYPDEQRFFFNHVEPARDAWGVAVCCGTSSIVRASALAEIGGVPTDSITEDYLLSLRFAERGWKTVYLNEPLSEGLAPEGLKEYIVQRKRWCLGMMQIVRNLYNPLSFRHRLNLIQRLAVLDSLLFWLTTFPFRLAAVIVPLFYWYSGIIVVNAHPAAIVEYFVPYYLVSLIALNWISRGIIIPLIIDVSQLIIAWPITQTVFTGLLSKGPHKFRVTAKGGDRSKILVQWRTMLPFAVLFSITLGGLGLPLVTDYNYSQLAGDGRIVTLIWTIYNLAILGWVIVLCIEQPRAAHSLRFFAWQGQLILGGTASAAWVSELSGQRARVRGPMGLSNGQSALLRLEGIGDIEASVTDAGADGTILHLTPTPAQRRAILAKVHTGAGTPSTVRGSLPGVIVGLLRHPFSLWRHELKER